MSNPLDRLHCRRHRPRGRLSLAWVALAALPLALGLACAKPASQQGTEDERFRRALAHRDLGADHLQHGDNALALRELLLSEEINPKDPSTQAGLAEAYRRQGHFAEAEKHLLRCIELANRQGATSSRSTIQLARLNLSSLYVQMERYPDSIEQSKLLANDPTFPAPWIALSNQGWAEYKLGRPDQARQTLGLALQYKDDFWRALLNLGILEAETGHKAEALPLFSRALAQKPGPLAEAEINYRIAEIYVSMGERDRALRHLTAAIQTKPSGEWGKRSEDYLKVLR
jgi:Tfp pilus assembly protein PilF